MDNVEKMKTAMIKNIKIGQNYRSTMSAVLEQLKNTSNVNKGTVHPMALWFSIFTVNSLTFKLSLQITLN